ncbi:unnamed protein product [marine sediment metagenome]|uniref:Uncharacterized protein n=1 Tax=marine sediment metagenome TaxID=412755 RepID=X1EJA3_9ZZZZ
MGWLYDDCKHCGEHYMTLLWPWASMGRWLVDLYKDTITIVTIGNMQAKCKKCGGTLNG